MSYLDDLISDPWGFGFITAQQVPSLLPFIPSSSIDTVAFKKSDHNDVILQIYERSVYGDMNHLWGVKYGKRTRNGAFF